MQAPFFVVPVVVAISFFLRLSRIGVEVGAECMSHRAHQPTRMQTSSHPAQGRFIAFTDRRSSRIKNARLLNSKVKDHKTFSADREPIHGAMPFSLPTQQSHIGAHTVRNHPLEHEFVRATVQLGLPFCSSRKAEEVTASPNLKRHAWLLYGMAGTLKHVSSPNSTMKYNTSYENLMVSRVQLLAH